MTTQTLRERFAAYREAMAQADKLAGTMKGRRVRWSPAWAISLPDDRFDRPTGRISRVTPNGVVVTWNGGAHFSTTLFSPEDLELI